MAEFAKPQPSCSTCDLHVHVHDGRAQYGANLKQTSPLDLCPASVSYASRWAHLLADFKFHDETAQVRFFADLLKATLWFERLVNAADLPMSMPMPLSRKRLHERGYNQALLLAQQLSQRKTCDDVVLRITDTPAQHTLKGAGLLASPDQTVAVDPLKASQLQGARLVLVDDVMTTSASLYTSVRVLRVAGAAHIINSVIARTKSEWNTLWFRPLAWWRVRIPINYLRDNAVMFHIVLVEPEIPPNTGNVIRLAANTGCTLHLVEPLGFSMDDKHMRRAGLDYHEYATVKRHASWQVFLNDEQPLAGRLFALTTRASLNVFEASFRAGDYLVFGSETKGLSEVVRQSFTSQRMLKLPMLPGQRSLNLSNAVAVAVFEAWRQNGFGSLKP